MYLSVFPSSGRSWKIVFLNIRLDYTSILFPDLFLLSDYEDSISGRVCLREGDHIYDKIASFQEKEMLIFIKQIRVTLSAKNTVSKIKWE